MTPRTVVIPGDGTNSLSFTIPSQVDFNVESVVASVDASGAGDTIGELSIAEVTGEVIATKRQGLPIPAGDSGTETWALRLDDEAAAAAGGGGFTNIFHETLAAEGRFHFASIPQTFRHLLVIVAGRINDPNGDVYMSFNGDTAGANYPTMLMEAQSAFVFGTDFTFGGIFLGYFAAALYPAGQIGTYAVMIPNYSGTTFFKQAFDAGGFPGGSLMEYDAGIGQWSNTSAITDLVISHSPPSPPGPPDFVAGSTLDVYGLG